MSRGRTSPATELLIELRRDDLLPLHSQVEQELRGAIQSGRLGKNTVLPSTRAMASQLGLSRGVVVEAYEQLAAEGYLRSQPGGATWVCADVVDPPPVADDRASRPMVKVDFSYGRPDVTQFPRQLWLRSIRRVLNEAPGDRLLYLDRRGAWEAREALAIYLNRVRGTAADADRVVICNGFAQAIRLVAEVVKASGGSRLAIEEPGPEDAVTAARFAGLEPVPVQVDDGGLVVDDLERANVQAVMVTPAHQFPTGAVLSAERRAALVAWAKRRDGLIVEDDYDAEYRYDREPIGAIQGLAPEHVIYAGSASKTLAPGLRLGWLIVPSSLVEQDRCRQGGGRPRFARPRAACVRRLPVAWRVRSPPAPDAPDLSSTTDPPSSIRCAVTCRSSARSARRLDYTWSPGCPTTSTRPRSSSAPPRPGYG